MISSTPTSHFITLPNRPIVQENGEITQGPLRLHYWQWKGHQPTVLICHGGMLHGRCYDRIINEALSGYHVIALDFRGHGQSEKHPIPYRFPWFGGDVYQFIECLDLSKFNLLGIGHSLGGYAITLAAAIASKQIFQSILLLDPGIYSSQIYEKGDRNLRKRSMITDRKSQWSSIEDMISDMDKSDRLDHWPKDILRDYCTHALDENFKLQCTPEVAAYIYRASVQPEADIYPIVKNSTFINQIPIHVVRASRSFINNRIPVMPTASDLANWFKKGRDTHLKDSSHSFPTEQPEIVVDLVKEMLEETKHFILNKYF
jgi:pimeloyl-ACP methyl ester carboxylesterase